MRSRWIVAVALLIPGCKGDDEGGGDGSGSSSTTDAGSHGDGSDDGSQPDDGGSTGSPGTDDGATSSGGTGSGSSATDGSSGGTGETTGPGSSATASTSGLPRDRVVFISSRQYTGSIGGIATGNDECQSMADAAGLSGTFMAWLGDGTEGPRERFTQDGRFVLVDGTLIAESWDDLTDGSIAHHIDQTEDGEAPPATILRCSTTQAVWTGAWSNGATGGTHCSAWTDDNSPGVVGRMDATDSYWTFACTVGACNFTASIYCFEQ